MYKPPPLPFDKTIAFFELVYNGAVQQIRGGDGNAIRGILISIIQASLLLVAFFGFMMLTGLRDTGGRIRGNFLVFIMTGIFLFLTHIKAVGAYKGKGSTLAGALMHGPVSSVSMVVSEAIGSLFKLVITVAVILIAVDIALEPVEIYDLKGMAWMFGLAWLSGAAVGLAMGALGPFFPRIMGIATLMYRRIQMVTSGKMFVANSIPNSMLPFFEWNPLFHVIDQSRGYAFINYVPRNSSATYPVWVILWLVVFAVVMTHWDKKYVSASWGKR